MRWDTTQATAIAGDFLYTATKVAQGPGYTLARRPVGSPAIPPLTEQWTGTGWVNSLTLSENKPIKFNDLSDCTSFIEFMRT